MAFIERRRSNCMQIRHFRVSDRNFKAPPAPPPVRNYACLGTPLARWEKRIACKRVPHRVSFFARELSGWPGDRPFTEMATRPIAVDDASWRDSLVRLARIAVHTRGAPDYWRRIGCVPASMPRSASPIPRDRGNLVRKDCRNSLH